ncbi:unnamed protein product [Eretmochelys imbricata]
MPLKILLPCSATPALCCRGTIGSMSATGKLLLYIVTTWPYLWARQGLTIKENEHWFCKVNENLIYKWKVPIFEYNEYDQEDTKGQEERIYTQEDFEDEDYNEDYDEEYVDGYKNHKGSVQKISEVNQMRPRVPLETPTKPFPE